MMTIGLRWVLFALVLAYPVLLQAQASDNAASATSTLRSPTPVSLQDLMPPDDLFGDLPTDFSWSHDDRYLSFRWHVKDATATDIWLYDWTTRSLRQLTSPQHFADHDPVAHEIVNSTESSMDEYSGVDAYDWAPDEHEMMLRYRGDWYRLALDEESLTRLTRTERREPRFSYSAAGDGYIYRDGHGFVRMRFDSSFVEEMRPSVPDELSIRESHLSPDETTLFVVAEDSIEPERRTVGYPSFRERFGQWIEHNRPLAEDDIRPSEDVHVFLQSTTSPLLAEDESRREILALAKDDGGPFSLSDPEWSEDGSRVAFMVYAAGVDEVRVYIASVPENKPASEVYRSKSVFPRGSRPWTLISQPPLFLPDGSGLVVVLDDSGYFQPWTIDLITQGKIPMVSGRFHALPLGFDKEGTHLYLWGNREHPIQKDLYALSLSNGYLTRMTLDTGAYSDLSVSHNGRYYAALFGNWNKMRELVVGDRFLGEEETVTDSHWFDAESIFPLKPKLFSYTNRHGQPVHGKLFLPPGWKPSDRRPLYVYTYGGPLGVQSGSKVHYDRLSEDNFRFPMYMALTHGYVTAVIDPRGSSGYDRRFTNANWMQPGVPQGEDLADGVAFLAESYGVDPERTALGGWSFGGTTTMMTMFTQPDVFTAGIAGAGVTEWENYYGGYTSWVIGPTEPDQPDQQAWSVLPHAKHLTGHLMLHHGIEDSNVLVQDTLKVYQALLKAGKGRLVDLVLDTTGGHGSGGGFNMGGDMTSVQRYELYEAYLLEHLGRYEDAKE